MRHSDRHLTKVAVVIPYFQRRSGILRRALSSVLRQRLLPGAEVNVIVVDDGSPVPAGPEADGLSFASPFHLTIIEEQNGGVASARNTALNSIDASTTYVAFLDSDDIWGEDHLRQGLGALMAGFDFYFCDNKRQGFHDSYFSARCPQILPFATAASNGGYAEIPEEALVEAILKWFPTQASTVIYRRCICPDHRFDEAVKAAGEDVLFMVQLAAKSRKSCFSTAVEVECAEGINVYFGNFGWDSPARLSITYDKIVSHSSICQRVQLSPKNRAWLQYLINAYKRDFVFFSLRYLAKKRKLPPELSRMAKGKPWYPLWFMLTAAQLAVMKPLGRYRPR
jgi:succinoglycan biosynthesis protein ExoW